MAKFTTSMKKKIVDIATEKFDAPKIASSRKKLSECKVVLITSAGVRLKSQKPYDIKNGDPTFRAIPFNIDLQDLTVNHGH